MGELPSDPTGTGLPFDPYGRRGSCGYGDGPVLQHRLHQFLNDERRTLPGHHPQVLELLGSSARKWRLPCALRDSLLDRSERRLYPGRMHWGLGFRTRIAACKPSAASAASLVPETAKTEEDIPESLSSGTVSESESCDANRGSLEVVFSADSLLQSLTPELAR